MISAQKNIRSIPQRISFANCQETLSTNGRNSYNPTRGQSVLFVSGKTFDPNIMQVHTSTRTSARYPMSKRESWWVVKHGMIKGGANSKQDTQSQWISTLGFTQDTHNSRHRVVVVVV